MQEAQRLSQFLSPTASYPASQVIMPR